MPTPSADDRRFRRALLTWFDRHKRPLPWRKSRDPYRVWVAEVMLQQTRIAVVEAAYRRFLRAFPTMKRLAAAGEDEVLSLWSGLGYYGRARALHRAAKLLAARGEVFPRDVDEARRLPGVGPYTAAAVLSIAYGEAHAAVDGNIVRVLSRLRRLARPNAGGEPHRSLAVELLCRSRPGDWNQALMELGEVVCLPKAPQCSVCPVARWCAAHRRGEALRFPPVRRRRAVEKVAIRLSVIRDADGRLLLERGAFPYLPHMWLPVLDATPASRERHQIVGRAVPGPPHIPHTSFRHAILHRQLEVSVRARTTSAAGMRRLLRSADGVERRLFTPGELRAIGRSSLLTKALAHVEAHHP